MNNSKILESRKTGSMTSSRMRKGDPEVLIFQSLVDCVDEAWNFGLRHCRNSCLMVENIFRLSKPNGVRQLRHKHVLHLRKFTLTVHYCGLSLSCTRKLLILGCNNNFDYCISLDCYATKNVIYYSNYLHPMNLQITLLGSPIGIYLKGFLQICR